MKSRHRDEIDFESGALEDLRTKSYKASYTIG